MRLANAAVESSNTEGRGETDYATFCLADPAAGDAFYEGRRGNIYENPELLA